MVYTTNNPSLKHLLQLKQTQLSSHLKGRYYIICMALKMTWLQKVSKYISTLNFFHFKKQKKKNPQHTKN